MSTNLLDREFWNVPLNVAINSHLWILVAVLKINIPKPMSNFNMGIVVFLFFIAVSRWLTMDIERIYPSNFKYSSCFSFAGWMLVHSGFYIPFWNNIFTRGISLMLMFTFYFSVIYIVLLRNNIHIDILDKYLLEEE